MEMGNNTENEFVIDLSETKNTAQLATELSLRLESEDTKCQDISLKLGSLDLKQSQLLSIKALIESIESRISSIYTDSEMTEASAVSLGILIKSDLEEAEVVVVEEDDSFKNSISEQIENLNDTFSYTDSIAQANVEETHELVEDNSVEFVTEVISPKEIVEEEVLTNPEVQAALDKVLGVQVDRQDNDIIKTNLELVESKRRNEDFEETETKERSSEGKYVLLDTEGITPEDMEENSENTSELQTLYLTQTLRSGQTVTYEGNIFIVGDVHPGSEVIATGDITVWGILGGIAHAGSNGNVSAKVRALKLNPIQLRIAGLYSRRNDTVNVPYIQRTNEFTPEEARINNKQIVVYKTLRRED